MPALERYQGTLYRTIGLKASIKSAVSSQDAPRVLILSALYGPLHPLSPIQDYNLKMDDGPAKSWALGFPRFLAEFAERNSIRRVALYVGTSTAYFKIAHKAVAPLVTKGRFDHVVQYHIVDGSTRETPAQHGILLAKQLTGEDCSSLFQQGRIQEVRL